MGNSNCKLDFLDRELQLEKSSKSSRSLSYETKMKYLYYLVHNFIQQNLHSSHSSNRTIMLNELKNINNKKNLYNLKNNKISEKMKSLLAAMIIRLRHQLRRIFLRAVLCIFQLMLRLAIH